LQCGFCTPGFLLLATELLARSPAPGDDEITEALGGNLCRCTGYVNIVRSVRRAAELVAEAEPESVTRPTAAGDPTAAAGEGGG
jgi:carbon-monoxide dehydrogenase small subunit